MRCSGHCHGVMAGAFEALVATAVGLFVAIPAIVAYNHFQRKVRATLSQIDSLAHLVLSNVHAAERRTTTPPVQPVQQMAKVTCWPVRSLSATKKAMAS